MPSEVSRLLPDVATSMSRPCGGDPAHNPALWRDSRRRRLLLLVALHVQLHGQIALELLHHLRRLPLDLVHLDNQAAFEDLEARVLVIPLLDEPAFLDVLNVKVHLLLVSAPAGAGVQANPERHTVVLALERKRALVRRGGDHLLLGPRFRGGRRGEGRRRGDRSRHGGRLDLLLAARVAEALRVRRVVLLVARVLATPRRRDAHGNGWLRGLLSLEPK